MSAVLQSPLSDAEDDFDPFAGGGFERVVATTEAQREVWLADQLSTEASLAYNEAVELQLHGPLDAQALRDALDALVARHESLRATFSADGTQLMIGMPGGLPLEEHDLSLLGADARDARLQEAAQAVVRQPFDLAAGPLLRASLWRVAPDDHRLLLVAHHAVCDGWSWAVVCRDLGQLYAQARGAAPAPGPAERYSDYAEWEQREAASPDMQAHVDFWVSRFPGSHLPVLELPTDRPRPPVRTFASERIDHPLDAALVDDLRRAGARAGTSLYAVMLAGFSALLHRLAGQDDLVVGIAAAGQLASEMHGLVGHCVNTLPLRIGVDPQAPFESLVRASGTTLLDAFEHQTLTYGTLLRKLPVQRDPSRLPLVNVLFNVDQDTGASDFGFGDLGTRLRSLPRAFENFELFLNITPVPGGMQMEAQYNRDLFDGASVRRWLAMYECLLQDAARDAGQPVSRLRVLPGREAAELRALQPAPSPLPADLRMHGAFEAAALASPEALALRHGDVAWTYRELDALSRRWAGALVARGIGRGDYVGLCLERGPQLVAALLAVLRSGAAYVPLDPAFPPARLDYYARDAQLALLITSGRVAVAPRQWREDAAQRVLDIDDPSWQAEPGAAAADAAPAIGRDDPAYVIYTSGSTGQPKGVAVPHGAVANFLDSMRRAPGIGAQDRLLAVTTLSFDIAVLELMLPLCVGAQVVIADRETALDGEALGRLIDATGATMMQATPGQWGLLLDAGWRARGAFRALVGGESLTPEMARRLAQAAGEVWNMYGPTETTIWSTLWRVEPALAARVGVSIGTPIANTDVWVLDEHLQPLPVGVPGELCIGGDGVALGYLGRQALTDERFVLASPGGQAQRLYRTGDRGRWRNDGLLEHRGRIDFQVKVRGYRIELGEIESALERHDAVERAVVVTREDTPGDVRIVAYLVPRGALPEPAALRDFLARTLPEYMLPQHVVALDALPLLPNGKVDRKSLPAPQLQQPAAERCAPRTPLETTVLAAMEDALSLPGIGIHDDFFALGGHSLLAARLTTRLGREFDMKVPLATLFQAPTAARLAEAIDQLRASGQAAAREQIPVSPDRRRAPLTPQQERIRFVETLFPGRPLYNAPSGHRFGGPLDIRHFEAALDEIVQRHAALRTRIGTDPGTGAPVQEILPRVDAALKVVDLRAVPEAEREARLTALMQAGADKPFDIHAGPLFRFALYRLADEEHAFLFVPHHLIWDGWSFDLLQAELSEIYSARIAGRAPRLPELGASYGDYAAWYTAWLETPDYARQLDFWRQRFARAPRPVALPTDRPRRAGMSGEGGNLWVRVDRDLAQRLREVAGTHDVTLSMLCFGIYVMMMGALSPSGSIVAATPVRGREQPELEPVMGFFNNVLPLSFTLDRSLGFDRFARYVKGELMAVMNYQQVPFERLVAEPEFAERVQGAGLYQALFSFQDARERPQRIGGLAHRQIHLRQQGATDDLSLWLMDKPSGLEGAVSYNADIYLPETGEALRERYLELLAAVAARPTATLAELLDAPDSRAAAHLRALAERTAPANEPAAAAGAPAVTSLLLPEQARLAQIWAGVIGIDVNDIAPSDTFFDLGGDSLMAMRVVQQAEAVMGFPVEPRRYVFETLAQLADAKLAAQAPAPAAPVQPAPAQPRQGLLSRWLSGRNR